MPKNRRTFLQAAAVAASGAAFAGIGRAENTDRPIRMGLIGAGKYGMTDAKAALRVGGVEVRAICDVDSEHLATIAQELETLQGIRPKTFHCHEDLLAESELDAVIIASPTHWHAIHFLAAIERGLDIYCEKPLAYDIREGRAMVDAAAKTGRVVQVGFQRRQSPALRDTAAFMADGGIGDQG
jgi:predicted dehydrogenase